MHHQHADLQSMTPQSARKPESAPQPSEALVDALVGLLSVCRSRPDAPDGGFERLLERLATFPENVALAALRRWPEMQHGAFAPTEHDLHQLCSALAAQDRAKHAAQMGAENLSSGRFATPTGASARVCRRVEAMDPAFARAWLRMGANCQFQADVIFVSGIGFDRIASRFAAVLDEEAVTLVACPQVSLMLARAAALAGNTAMPDARAMVQGRAEVRRPQAPETLAERREVIAALRAAGFLPKKQEAENARMDR